MGYRILTLGYTDGTTFLPLGFSLLASQKEKNMRGDCNLDQYKKNSLAYKRRKLALSDTLDVLVQLVNRARKLIKNVDHLCADRWFSDPNTIYDLKSQTGMEVISVLKHNKTKYEYNGETHTIAEIYKMVRKHPGLSRYLAEVNIHVPGKGSKNHPFDAKVVFVRNKANRKQWIAIISTDMSLSAEDIIQYYALRWKTEVFFWTAKMYLRLNGECHATSYDAVTAHATIVCVRYIMLAIEQRMSEDKRTLGELIALITEEVKEADIASILQMFSDCVFDAVNDTFKPTPEQMTQFTDHLIGSLPDSIARLLSRVNIAEDRDDEPPLAKKSKKTSSKLDKQDSKKGTSKTTKKSA